MPFVAGTEISVSICRMHGGTSPGAPKGIETRSSGPRRQKPLRDVERPQSLSVLQGINRSGYCLPEDMREAEARPRGGGMLQTGRAWASTGGWTEGLVEFGVVFVLLLLFAARAKYLRYELRATMGTNERQHQACREG